MAHASEGFLFRKEKPGTIHAPVLPGEKGLPSHNLDPLSPLPLLALDASSPVYPHSLPADPLVFLTIAYHSAPGVA